MPGSELPGRSRENTVLPGYLLARLDTNGIFAFMNAILVSSMKKIRLLVLLLGILAAPLTAAQPETGLLWKIEADGGRTSYLFGTIHSEDARVLDFPTELLTALGATDVFAMELIPDLPTLSRLTELMHYQDGTTLEEEIGSELFGSIVGLLANYGVPASMIMTMKPWAVAMTISVPPPETGMFMDFSLSLRAAGMGLKVRALETLEEQVGFLEGMMADDQLKILQMAVDNHAELPAQLEEMIKSYLGRDLDELNRIAIRQLRETDPDMLEYFQEAGINKRNHRMFSRLQPLMAGQSVFVAIGALHLGGETGLITLLREAGYTLTPVW
jgi:uncharacterized protein YbaP (TraB family)